MFTLNENSEYLVYGAGGVGIKTLKVLTESQRKVLAIIDKRGEENGNFRGVPVITPEQLGEYAGRPNIVCVITIKNVFSHSEIAQMLVKHGINRLIYKPFKALQGVTGEWEQIDRAYEELITNRVVPDNMIIPESGEEEPVEYRDVLLTEMNENEVLAYLPTELLCNYDKDMAWGRLPMYSYFPTVEFYRFLFEGVGYWEEVRDNYLLYCGSFLKDSGLEMTEGQKQSFISSRVDVFHEMQKKYDRMHSFFEKIAPSVIYKGALRFYLNSSGRNRVSFQVARGAKYIPVRMDRNCYDAWVNQAGFDDFEEYLSQKKLYKLFTLVPHPYLQEFPCIASDYARVFCEYIVNDIIKIVCKHSVVNCGTYDRLSKTEYLKQMSKIKVATLLADNGTLNRMLKNAGIENIRLYNDKNKADCEISNKLDALLCVQNQEQGCVTGYYGNANILVVDSEVCLNLGELFSKNVSIIYVLSHQGETGATEFVKEIKHYSILPFGFEMWNGEEVRGYRIEITNA